MSTIELKTQFRYIIEKLIVTNFQNSSSNFLVQNQKIDILRTKI